MLNRSIFLGAVTEALFREMIRGPVRLCCCSWLGRNGTASVSGTQTWIPCASSSRLVGTLRFVVVRHYSSILVRELLHCLLRHVNFDSSTKQPSCYRNDTCSQGLDRGGKIKPLFPGEAADCVS